MISINDIEASALENQKYWGKIRTWHQTVKLGIECYLKHMQLLDRSLEALDKFGYRSGKYIDLKVDADRWDGVCQSLHSYIRQTYPYWMLEEFNAAIVEALEGESSDAVK
jgi:hypothetical protein